MINLKIKNNSFLKYYLTTNIISFYNLNAMENVKKKDINNNTIINNEIINNEKINNEIINNENEKKQNLNEIKKFFKFNDINIEIEENKKIYNSIKIDNPIYNYFYYNIEYFKNTKYNKYAKNKNFQENFEIIFSNKNKTFFNNISNKDYFNKFDFNENQIKNNNIINKDYSKYKGKDANYVTAIFENTPNDDIISIKRNCNYVSDIIKEYENEKKYRIYFNENLKKLNYINVFKKLKISGIDLQNFNIYNITDISNMFDNCQYLKNITFGGKFNTSKVENFRGMFAYCTSLEILDLSNLNLNINVMNKMFIGCFNLKSLNLSNLNISNTKKENLHKIFNKCSKLESLNLSNIKGDAICFFYNNKEDLLTLKNLDLSNTTTYCENLNETFEDMENLENLNLSNVNISCVKSLNYLFYNCRSLNTLNLENFNISQIHNIRKIFTGCKNLSYRNIINCGISKEDIHNLFRRDKLNEHSYYSKY